MDNSAVEIQNKKKKTLEFRSAAGSIDEGRKKWSTNTDYSHDIKVEIAS